MWFLKDAFPSLLFVDDEIQDNTLLCQGRSLRSDIPAFYWPQREQNVIRMPRKDIRRRWRAKQWLHSSFRRTCRCLLDIYLVPLLEGLAGLNFTTQGGGGLFQTLNRLLEFKNMFCIYPNNEALGLIHVYVVLEPSVEEVILYIHTIYIHVMVDWNGQHSSRFRQPNQIIKSLSVVDSEYLTKSFCDQTRLE